MSDTDLNDELMKNVTEQTAFLTEEEMQGPMTLGETLAENFNVMTREQLSRQYELLDKRHRELVTEYQKRKNQASLKEAKPAVKRVIEKRGVDYSVPREPDLAGKKKKNRRKELAKKKKKALAFNPEATEYTTDILALEKERSSRREYMAEFDKRFLDFVKPLESTAEAERIRNLEQCWSGITVFAPKLVLGKKGVPTEESRKRSKTFITIW